MRHVLIAPTFGAGLFRTVLLATTLCLGIAVVTIPAYADSDGDVNVGGEHILTVRDFTIKMDSALKIVRMRLPTG